MCLRKKSVYNYTKYFSKDMFPQLFLSFRVIRYKVHFHLNPSILQENHSIQIHPLFTNPLQ